MDGGPATLFVATLLLAAGLAGCANAASSLPEGPRVFDTASAGPATPFEAFDTMKPTLYDLDADGDLEVVAHNDNNRVVVLDAVTGRTLAELTTKHPGIWNVRELNDVVATDLDADGRPDLVVANSAGWLTRFELDAYNSTSDHLAFTRLWEVRVDPRQYDPTYRETHPWIKNGTAPSMDGGAYVADVDDDGKKEIFVQTDGWPGHFAFQHDGTLRWMNTWSDGNSNPWVADLDGDGRLEAVYVTDGGRIYVYDADKGYLDWTFHAIPYGVTPGSISISPAVADLDGDGRKELVFGARQAVEDKADPDWMDKQHTMLFAVSAPPRGGEPTLLWNVTFPWLAPHAYTHPAVVDVDGNGKPDVLSMDWNTIGHKPGQWETTGNPHLFALDGRTGRLIWKQTLESPWNNKDLAVGDVDGDGSQEIVLADPRHGESSITFRDLRTGAYESSMPLPGWGGIRGPQLADVDGDGALDVVQALSRPAEGCTRDLDVGCREGAIMVLPTAGSKAAWSGRFTFDASTETAYTKRDTTRTVVGDVTSDDGVTTVRVEGDAKRVTVRDRSTVMELTEDEGTWRAHGTLPEGARVEVEVRFAHAKVVAPRAIAAALSAPPPALDPPRAPASEVGQDPTEAVPPEQPAPVAPALGRDLEPRSFDGTDLAVGGAAVAVLAGLAVVAWVLRGTTAGRAVLGWTRWRT